MINSTKAGLLLLGLLHLSNGVPAAELPNPKITPGQTIGQQVHLFLSTAFCLRSYK